MEYQQGLQKGGIAKFVRWANGRCLAFCLTGFLGFLVTDSNHLLAAEASQTVQLAWDANTEPDVAGYKVYWGTSSGQYSQQLSVGAVTTAQIPDLAPGVTYYFAATALNTEGLESDYSAEIEHTPTFVNTPPVLAAIPPQTVPEGGTLVFVLSASDADLPAQALTFAMGADAPAGATFDPATATFTWTPSEAQGPSSSEISFTVIDEAGASSTQSVTVSVTEVNTPPVLAAIPPQTVPEGGTLVFVLSASDADLPAQALTFAMGADAPAGAAFDPAMATFTWTPSEAQGPSSSEISFTVIDEAGASSTQSVTVSVTEVNTAPVLAAIPPQTVPEGGTLVFVLSASDADLPAQALTFAMGADAPAGATFDPATATFTWTPSEAQGPSSSEISFTVIDEAGASSTQSVTVSVTEVNTPPVLAAIPPQTVPEGGTLIFVLSASDADLPAQALTFAMGADAPAGATFDPATATFTWTPSEAQGPSSSEISFTVIDEAGASSTQSVTVSVTEVNTPPSINPLPNYTLVGGSTVSFTATGSDPDLPAGALTWTLGAGAPAGAKINSGTGAFSWKTPKVSKSTLYTITLWLTDNGSPAAAASSSFTVTLDPAVRRASLELAEQQVRFEQPVLHVGNRELVLSWQSEPGRRYRLESRDLATGSPWMVVGDYLAEGDLLQTALPLEGGVGAIYRVAETQNQ
ncbi:MAG: Ig domain-containing protein [Limisphaerales bacterium]